MRSSVSEAKRQIRRWESLVKAATELGYHVSDEFSSGEYDYIITTNALKRHLPVMIELLEASGFHKKYLLWTLKDIDEIVVFIAAIAMSKGKVLDIDDNDKWTVCDPEKFSVKECKSGSY